MTDARRRVLRYASIAALTILVLLLGLRLLYSVVDLSDENNYRDMSEVTRDRAIERGWIPANMPQSAVNIHEWHNMDTNEGHGDFSFSLDDSSSFVQSMEGTIFADVDPSVVPRSEGENAELKWYRYKDFFYGVDWAAGKARFWLDYHHPDESGGDSNPGTTQMDGRPTPRGAVHARRCPHKTPRDTSLDTFFGCILARSLQKGRMLCVGSKEGGIDESLPA